MWQGEKEGRREKGGRGGGKEGRGRNRGGRKQGKEKRKDEVAEGKGGLYGRKACKVSSQNIM